MIRLDELNKRLNRVEASNRRMRIGVCSLTAAIFAIGLLAAVGSTANVVEAEEFRLLDADGQLRASLSLSNAGNAKFAMADSHGKRRIILGIQEYGPSLRMMSAKGDSLISLDATSKLVSLRIGGGKTGRCSVDASADGSAVLQLSNSAGSETLFAHTDGLLVNAGGQQRRWPGQ